MRNCITIFLIIFSISLNAQNKIDKLFDEMCSNFRINENLNDSIRFQILNENFILPYINQFSGLEKEEKIDYLFFQFQKRCEYFRDYLQKKDPPKGDNWVKLSLAPRVTISKKEINEFKKNNSFYYFEYAGEKTKVKINKNYWTEIFLDGTYSKLFYKWISTNKFELEFIESNNIGIINFSKKGEKYIYEIINKENNFYWILIENKEQSEILKFKLFIE